MTGTGAGAGAVRREWRQAQQAQEEASEELGRLLASPEALGNLEAIRAELTARKAANEAQLAATMAAQARTCAPTHPLPLRPQS